MKKILGIVVAVVVVLFILMFLSKGFGLGGSGTGEGKNTTEQTESSADDVNEEAEEIISKLVTVTIKENKVFVGNKDFNNAEDLKMYIEEINNDEIEFNLKEENSILDTYEWVIEVFEDLKISIVSVEK